jgi:hypothetical protein
MSISRTYRNGNYVIEVFEVPYWPHGVATLVSPGAIKDVKVEVHGDNLSITAKIDNSKIAHTVIGAGE